MRTNIDIDETLMHEAMRITRSKTKKAAVEQALKELILHEKRKELLSLRGKLHWEGNLDEMRQT